MSHSMDAKVDLKIVPLFLLVVRPGDGQYDEVHGLCGQRHP